MARSTLGSNVIITLDDAPAHERLAALQAELGRTITDDAPSVVVDLSAVDMLDSALLAAVLAAAASAAERGRLFSLIAGSRLYRGLNEWRFDSVVTIAEAQDAS